jgi:hypothetical protein
VDGNGFEEGISSLAGSVNLLAATWISQQPTSADLKMKYHPLNATPTTSTKSAQFASSVNFLLKADEGAKAYMKKFSYRHDLCFKEAAVAWLDALSQDWGRSFQKSFHLLHKSLLPQCINEHKVVRRFDERHGHFAIETICVSPHTPDTARHHNNPSPNTLLLTDLMPATPEGEGPSNAGNT